MHPRIALCALELQSSSLQLQGLMITYQGQDRRQGRLSFDSRNCLPSVTLCHLGKCNRKRPSLPAFPWLSDHQWTVSAWAGPACASSKHRGQNTPTLIFDHPITPTSHKAAEHALPLRAEMSRVHAQLSTPAILTNAHLPLRHSQPRT